MRKGVCSEELCFGNAALSTFFSLGNGIPIQRGGTIHQRSIAELQAWANAGGWVHLFSEGRVWQEVGNPLRDKDGRWCSNTGRCVPPYSSACRACCCCRRCRWLLLHLGLLHSRRDTRGQKSGR